MRPNTARTELSPLPFDAARISEGLSEDALEEQGRRGARGRGEEGRHAALENKGSEDLLLRKACTLHLLLLPAAPELGGDTQPDTTSGQRGRGEE